MKLIRSNQAEVQTDNGFVTTLLAKVVFESEDVTERLVEHPNLYGNEEFVKVVVTANVTEGSVGSTLTIIRRERDSDGVERTQPYTRPIFIDSEGVIRLDQELYFEDTALALLVPFMSEWLQELVALAKENLAKSLSEIASISESESVSHSLSVSHSESESISISESLSAVESQSTSFSEMTSNSLVDYSNQLNQSLSTHQASVSTSVSESLSALESEVYASTSVSLSELASLETSLHQDSLSAVSSLVDSQYQSIESLALKLEPVRLSYELGELDTGDLVEGMGQDIDLEDLQDEITEVVESGGTSLDYSSEATDVLTELSFERSQEWSNDVVKPSETVSPTSSEKPKKRGFFKRLFSRKDKQYEDLVKTVVHEQLTAAQKKADSVSIDEVHLANGSIKIDLPNK